MNQKVTPNRPPKAKAPTGSTRKASASRTVSEAAVTKDEKSARKQETCSTAKLDLHQMICTEAYFRAERRGFAAGGELQDWFEAEQAVKQQLGTNANASS